MSSGLRLAQWLSQLYWRTHRSQHAGSPTAFHLPLAFLMGLKKSFQRAIHVWWLYWFSFPLSSLPLLPSLITPSPVCHPLLTQVHIQLHAPSCLLPFVQPFPSSCCYWLPYFNAAIKTLRTRDLFFSLLLSLNCYFYMTNQKEKSASAV